MQVAGAERIRLLGVEVDLVTPQQMLAKLERMVTAGGVSVIANHNAHSIYLSRRDEALRDFFAAADLIEIDSRPMILWGQALGLPVGPQHRSTYLDWRNDFWDLTRARGWRVFYLGGAPGVAERAIERLTAEWPGLQLGAHDGYFDPDGPQNDQVLAAIEAFEPHIVLVGMGMPRQEAWIHANRAKLARGVLFSIGAAFDYEAGAQSVAPRWMGRAGLEWLYRLATQPTRLGYRYLVEPWFLLPAASEDLAVRLTGRATAAARPVGVETTSR